LTPAPPSARGGRAARGGGMVAPCAYETVAGSDPEVTGFTTDPPATAPDHGGDGDGLHLGASVRYFGDYEICRELARGGMGIVFLARQTSLNRAVALKMILAGRLANESDVRRFYTEAEAAANLDHPGIVPIYEVGQHEGQHYFSMGFVEGQSLAQRLADGPLPPRDAAVLVAKVAEAIEYAHSRGVIHRDLKPANILVDRQGQPRVTDFGLAKSLQSDGRLTGSGQIMGTPSYMPPEQAAAKHDDVGPAADVYALGATLYALLTGRPPFQAATAMDTVLLVIGEDPVPPRRLNASIARDLETICLKCLEKDPKRRYASAAALGEDLTRWIEGRPIRARPVSPVERAAKWAARRPAVAGLLVAVIAVTVLGFVLVTWQWRVAVEQRQRAITQTRLAEARAKAEVEARQAAVEQEKLALEQTHRAELSLYGNQIGTAQQTLLAGDFGEARASLDRTRPEFRGWEYRHVEDRLTRTMKTLSTGLDWTVDIAYNPDGRRMAAVGIDFLSSSGALKLLDVGTGKTLFEVRSSGPPLARVCFSQDGSRLATDYTDSSVRVWDARDGRPVATFTGHTGLIGAIALRPDGRRAASVAEDGTLRIWDAATGAEVRAIPRPAPALAPGLALLRGVIRLNQPVPPGLFPCLHYSPDGSRLAWGAGDASVRIIEAETGAVLRQFHSGGPAITRLAFSRDGQKVAGGGLDDSLHVWEVETGEKRLSTKGSAGPTVNRGLMLYNGKRFPAGGVAFSSDGRWIALGADDRTVRVCHAASGKTAQVLRGHEADVVAVAFSPSGDRLASASARKEVRLWALEAKPVPLELDLPVGAVMSGLAFRPDGRRMFSASGLLGVLEWNTETWQTTATRRGAVGFAAQIACSGDGRLVASREMTNGQVFLWNSVGDAMRRKCSGPLLNTAGLCFRPDSRQLAGFGNGPKKRLVVWDTATGEVVWERDDYKHYIYSMAYSPDGRILVTSSSEAHGPRIWDAATGRELASFGTQSFAVAIAFDPGGRTLAGVVGTRLVFWDVASRRVLRESSLSSGFTPGLLYAPDGRRLFSWNDQGTFTVHDAGTGLELLKIKAHPRFINGVALSPDGRTLVTSDDSFTRVWQAPP
jgi:WD40 repeat protein/predicted Ser/Thr protein kinase